MCQVSTHSLIALLPTGQQSTMCIDTLYWLFFYYPVYLINQGLMSLLGINCVQFLVAFVLLISSLYAFLLMMRIGKDLLHLSQRESSVLAFLLFSFAYVLLAAISPDHFILSLFLILLVIYVTGKQMAERKPLKRWQTIVFFILLLAYHLIMD